MSEAASIWRDALDRLERGQRVFYALVVDHTRHSPGTRGARLIWTEADGQRGTIGGGIMEARALEAARDLLAASASRAAPASHAALTELTHRRSGPGARSGLICAGRQTNLTCALEPPRDTPAVAEIVARLDADRDGEVVFCPAHGLSVREPQAPITPDTPPIEAVRTRDTWQVIERLGHVKRVVIFGGGHCGLALSRVMATLGYVVTIADVRPDVPTLAVNEAARHVLVADDYEQIAARVAHPALTCAVVMTADFPSDVRALTGALRLDPPFPFIGLMGAPAKLRAIQAALGEQGLSPEAIARITAPVGLPIGSSTPEEIAVSVAAQLVQLRPELFPGTRPSPLTPEASET